MLRIQTNVNKNRKQSTLPPYPNTAKQLNMEREKIALITVLGTSPAVLTETVWGLYTEKPELVPDEVKVYTTVKGWETFNRRVLSQQDGPSVWEDLQAKVGKEIVLRKHIFEDNKGGDLKDIVTCEDQELVADQLLKGIREYKNPKQEHYRLVGSVAGGRKSMSALMYAAMSLGADADDIVTHVLVDDAVLPFQDFYFSGQEKQHLETISRGGEALTLTAAEVKIDLAELPFVPLATLVKNSDFDSAGSFSQLVQRARQTVAKIRPRETKIRISKSECKVYINDEPLELPLAPYLLFTVTAGYSMQHKGRADRILRTDDVYDTISRLKEDKKLPPVIINKTDAKAGAKNYNKFFKLDNWNEKFPDDLERVKSELKKILINSGYDDVVKDIIRHGNIGFCNITDIKFIK